MIWEDHTQAPLVDAVRFYREADALPFTTPGHKRGTGIAPDATAALSLEAFRNDVPLGAGIDDSHFSHDLLGHAERLAADAFSADRSFFLVNGSSIGNQAAILALAAPGEQIVVARNAHSSILAALILGGARPVYVQPRYDPDLEVAHGVEAADLAATLDAHPRVQAVVLTSPSYFGVASDLPRLAALCHERGLPLHVDEAWAAHFPFHPGLPPSAMQAGADSAVTSIHKLLTGFGQSALLNVRDALVDPAAVSGWLRLLQTTSPSALILASIDASRRQMMLEGRELLDRTLALAAMARERIGALPGLQVMGAEVLGRPGAAAFDPTKLVIDVAGTGHTGYWVEAWLRADHRITVEMSDHRRVVALLSVADTQASVGRLLAALATLPEAASRPRDRRVGVPRDLAADMDPEVVLTPAEAYRSPAQPIPLADAAGQIGAEALTPYPPGIPLLAPGERITPHIVAYLQAGLAAGMHVAGASDPTLATVLVVCS